MILRSILTAVTVFFIFSVTLYSQNFTLTGKIKEKETNSPLTGASIRVLGSNQGAIADKSGNFKIENIKSSNIRIVASYLGHIPDTLSISFDKGNSKNITIELATDSEKMDEVEVEAKAEGQVKAMLEQKRAANIKNVVSSEQIQQFPDLNAAEAMQRIPGITLQRDQGEGRYVQLRGTPPELTNFNINGEQIPSPEGDVRYVGMDIISADQIEFIEVSKVLTPDMDADGIGGTVNIITKKAQSEKPDINATLAGGFNEIRETMSGQVQYSYGQRYKNFGFNMNASYYVNNQGSDNMEFKYSKGPFWGSQDDGKDNYHVQYREVQLRHYTITRARTGLSATMDYEFNKNSNIYLRGMYNNFEDDELRRRKIYDLDDAINLENYLYGGIEHDIRNRIKEQNVSSLNLGGNHEFLGMNIDYEVAYAYATEDQPDRMEVRFDNPGQAIYINFDKTDPNWPKANFPEPQNAQNAYDYDNYRLDQLLFESVYITDENYTGKLNFEIPYAFGTDHMGFFKFGGKVRLKHKVRDITTKDYGAYRTTSNLYPGEGAELSVESVGDGFVETNFLGQGYEISKMPDYGRMLAFYDFYNQFFIFDRTGTKMRSFGQDYEANENIYAVYGMVRHEWDNLMILGGLRFEQTQIDYQGMKINTDRGRFESMDTLTDVRTLDFMLPQFQIKYSPFNDFNLRAALTYSYARPNFEDVLPYREQDREEVKYGNPNLNFPRSMNVDLLAEKYFSNGGLIQGGVFYKKIDDFVFYYKRFAHEGEDFSNYGLVEIEKAINGNDAFVFGSEIQLQSTLDFLPGFWSNFGVFLNYTFTHSEAYINKRFSANYADAIVIFGEDDLSLFSSDAEEEKITLPGQAEHSTNLALFYDGPRFYAKISANYHDAFLYELGADPDLDEFYDSIWRLDFTANYRLSDNFKVFVDVMNLNNAPLRFYLGTPDQIKQQEYYSWTARTGLKISF
jgi:TonB-dependent receptor